MNFKILSFLSVLLVTSHSYAAKKLDSYEMLLNSLMNGSNVKVIYDFKNDCKLISKTPQNELSKKTYSVNGLLIDKFVIQDPGHIVGFVHVVNSPDGQFPANYITVEIDISPDEKITIDAKTTTLPNYQVSKSWLWSCTFGKQNSNGVKFFEM